MSDEELTPEDLGKKSFQVMMRKARDGSVEKAIFIGGELLDWQIDLASFVDAASMGPTYMREIQRDIEKHFVESVSDFLGRKVTIEEIKQAIQVGWI
jgi:carbon monoxide dehydrogenase subunit G